MTLVNLAYCGIKDSQVWIQFTQKLDSRVLLLNNSTDSDLESKFISLRFCWKWNRDSTIYQKVVLTRKSYRIERIRVFLRKNLK